MMPILLNRNAVNARQWSLARSPNGFLRRTDRRTDLFRSIVAAATYYVCCVVRVSEYPFKNVYAFLHDWHASADHINMVTTKTLPPTVRLRRRRSDLSSDPLRNSFWVRPTITYFRHLLLALLMERMYKIKINHTKIITPYTQYYYSPLYLYDHTNLTHSLLCI